MSQWPNDRVASAATTGARLGDVHTKRAFDVVAMTASLGGLDALSHVLGALPPGDREAFLRSLVTLYEISRDRPSR